jgi:hypothetical protein
VIYPTEAINDQAITMPSTGMPDVLAVPEKDSWKPTTKVDAVQ